MIINYFFEGRTLMLNFFSKIIRKFFGTANERELAKLWPVVKKINEFEQPLTILSDDDLKARAKILKDELSLARKNIDDEVKKIRDLISGAISMQERSKYKKKLKELKNSVISPKLPEVFALVREASKRTIGLRHFDVQLIGGMVLHEGRISEMTTGEGKTLVATLAASLNAFTGETVHIVTVNDYLAKRDAEWMRKIYEFLGLTVGVIQHDMRPDAKKGEYSANIVYGTNNEFGFDYLRDNMVDGIDSVVQSYQSFVIVDEVDSILIDEARTPLIISGPVDETNEAYNKMRPVVDDVVRQQKRLVREFVEKFKLAYKDGKDELGTYLYLIHKADPKNREFLDIVLKDRKAKAMLDRAQSLFDSKTMEKERDEILEQLYYVYDEKTREATFSAKGQSFMKEHFGIEFMLEDIEAKLAEIASLEISDEERILKNSALMEKYTEQERNVDSVKQLLKAYILFEKDVDYVVHENKIVIVDEFTGRMMPGRRFSEGIHEALEAKERVEVQRESQTLATITLQNYFRMYDKLAGMTGTAKTEEAEFENIYLLPVVQIPTNKPMSRQNMPDRIYKTEKEKFDAIVNDVEALNKKGAPVLVGTISIEKSEHLSKLLTKKGVKHNVLNAKYHEREAHIISQAGRYGSVTIATNMAGRGTDILLGGNPAEIAKDKTAALNTNDIEAMEKAYAKFFEASKQETQIEHDEVLKTGGLHVIGTERHESRRIDDQLRGRSGRQGDPGSSRFHLSLEDDLMRIFGSDKIKSIMDRLGMEEGEVIENPLVSHAIRTAQKRVEMQHFEIRKHLLKYDDIMNKQREVIYKRRRIILESDNLVEEFLDAFASSIEPFVKARTETLEESVLLKELTYKYAICIKPEELDGKTQDEILDFVIDKAREAYSSRELIIGKERFTRLTRWIMLTAIDSHWKEYLREIDELREGISWRAYGQKDPFIEFQYEAFEMFQKLVLKTDSVISERIMLIHAVEQAPAVKNVFDSRKAVCERKDFSAISSGGMRQGESSMEENPSVTRRREISGNKRENIGNVLDAQSTFKRDGEKVGRNDDCPCGSGKKYKKCCGK
ncbi:preprotein translocase subunit SecA [Candidatus Omnitrophus magneticus]|uniref:Protein translocase subunit SecA n=1 Tax=Candidatus Omnitrophus magneticus TaxID=1609969 RepID=A0A0F0CRB8_9BACT|nr:preprotein translocase subunit SecA [Candidatus Omnitrophus magneticus]